MGAVIDGGSFKTQKAAIDEAKARTANGEVLVGGGVRRLATAGSSSRR